MKLPDPLQNVPEGTTSIRIGTFCVTYGIFSETTTLTKKGILLVTSHTLKHR